MAAPPPPSWRPASTAPAAPVQQQAAVVPYAEQPSPWTHSDITRANGGALMSTLMGDPLFGGHDINAAGTTTSRDQRHYANTDAYGTVEGMSDNITHHGLDGLLTQVTVEREQWQDNDGSYGYDHRVRVTRRQPRRRLGY